MEVAKRVKLIRAALEEATIRNHLRRIIGFAFVPAMTMISTIVILPIISYQFGPTGWSALGLGQSVGAFVSIACGLAWQVVGGQRVAAALPGARPVIYAESIKSRGAALALTAPAAAALVFIFSPEYKLEACLFAIAMSLNCLNASWYFSGTGEARLVLRNEAMVRFSGYLIAIPVLQISQSLWTYAVILLVVGVTMAVLNIRTVIPNGQSAWASSRPLQNILREQASGTVSRSVTAASQYLNIAIVAALIPQSLPLFTAVDNTIKATMNASSFYPQAFAWWVGSAPTKNVTRWRIVRLLWGTAVVGIAGFALWAILGRVIFQYLFHGEIEIGENLILLCGGLLATTFISRGWAMLAMVPLGLEANIYLGSLIASVVNLIALVAGINPLGVNFAVGVSASLQTSLCSYYLFRVLTVIRQRP